MKLDTAALRHAVAALGARFDPDVLQATRAIYAQAIRPAPACEIRADLDIRYGPDERHRVDVYRPAGSQGGRAIVLFVHGGGFVAGDKRGDDLYYGNVGRFFASVGCIGAVMTYRHAPKHPWPAGAEDVKRVVDKLRADAAVLGGDAAKLVVIGTSAGASHVASWLWDARIGATPADEAAGVVLMSGFFRARAPLGAGPLAYFGADASAYEDRSPLTHVKPTSVPVLLTVGQFDPGWITVQSHELAAAMTNADGHGPRFAWLDGHNHTSYAMGLGSVQDDAGRLLRDFVAACTGA